MVLGHKDPQIRLPQRQNYLPKSRIPEHIHPICCLTSNELSCFSFFFVVLGIKYFIPSSRLILILLLLLSFLSRIFFVDVGKTVAQISSTQDAENAATAFQDQKGEITSCSCRDRLGSSIQFYKSK